MTQGRRYLVITELFLPTKGGTAVWFDEVYRRIGGKEIHIVTADVPGAIQHDREHPNTIHRISLARHWWLRPESLAMYVKLLSQSLTLVFKHRFDAVHTGRALPEGLVGWIVSRLIRKPLVVYAHGEEITTWRQPAKFRTMRFVYRHAERVIANSEFTQEELLKIGVQPERISLIYPGVNLERFRPDLESDDLRESIGISRDQKLILSVGRLSRRKGFDQVIKSLPRLVAQGIDVHYVLIGIGEDEQYLKRLAEENDVVERVHMLGHVSLEDLPRWYTASDVFAMPNRVIDGDTEGFGMVFIEAAACKKPVLAGIGGGTGAAVIDGYTGLRVDGEQGCEVVAGLERLLSDREFADELGAQGFERAVKDFSWDIVAKTTMGLSY